MVIVFYALIQCALWIYKIKKIRQYGWHCGRLSPAGNIITRRLVIVYFAVKKTFAMIIPRSWIDNRPGKW